MFPVENNLNNKNRKRKALICAILVTFVIALLYVIFSKDNLYRFGSVKKDIAPVASFIKDVSKGVPKDVVKDSKVINNE